MVKLRMKAMNRDNIVSIEPKNTLHGIGFSLFNNLNPQHIFYNLKISPSLNT